MRGTALLIGKDHTVTAIEGVSQEVYKDLARQENLPQINCKIDEKEVQFESVSEVVWHENSIDWSYGY